ncbi:MAG: ABC transporter permease [Ilumatobacteraceae bacterium]
MGERLERTARITQREIATPSLPRKATMVLRNRPRLALASVLTAPLTWLLVVYIGSLSLLVVSAFFRLDSFTGKSTSQWTLSNITEVTTKGAYLKLVLKSVGVATAATLICLTAAIPTAFYISKCAAPWAKRGLIVAMLLPLWAGYLVKAYALRAVFDPGSAFGSGGFLSSTFGWSPGFGYVAVTLTLAYLWFPYMLLPVYAGFERLPDSLLDASSDLGAGAWRTFGSVVMPLLVPSIAAGSIFTFSLSLGDYISVKVVGGTSQMIGNIIERALLAPNQPLAAAFTLWPISIMVLYLLVMGRLGAFKNL